MSSGLRHPGGRDPSRDGSHFNLSLGVLGLAIGLGGTLGNTVDGRSPSWRFAAAGVAAVAAVALFMPEAKPLPGTKPRAPAPQ